MFRDLSPGAVSINATFDETIALAKRHGFQGVDLPSGDAAFLANPEAFRDKVKAAGLKWGGFGLPTDFRGDEANYQRGMEVLKVQAPAARRAGCTRCFTWIMPASNTLDFAANFEQHAKRLKPIAKLLADEGIRFGIEFVGPATLRAQFKHAFVHDIDGILKLADAASSNTGVLLDCFHWYTSKAKPADITGKLKGRVVYVHVNDARAARTPEQQIDNERALPGDTGVIDIKAFLTALREIGYDGPVAAEPFMPELGKQPADETAARVAASLKKVGL